MFIYKIDQQMLSHIRNIYRNTHTWIPKMIHKSRQLQYAILYFIDGPKANMGAATSNMGALIDEAMCASNAFIYHGAY